MLDDRANDDIESRLEKARIDLLGTLTRLRKRTLSTKEAAPYACPQCSSVEWATSDKFIVIGKPSRASMSERFLKWWREQ